MKSVLTTFSQSTGNVLSKVCLVVLCVFVISSVGSAQSFVGVVDAKTKLRSSIQTMNVDLEGVSDVKEISDNELDVAKVEPVEIAELVDEQLRRSYFSLVLKYVPNQQFNSAVATAIDEAHARMVGKNPNHFNQLATYKQQVTDLLSN